MASSSTFKISDEVRAVLARSTITATTVTLPPEQLDRQLYTQVNKAPEGAGGKWNRKAKAHVFDRDPREALGMAVETGRATNIRTELQAFYTPDALADRVVAATGIAQHPDVLLHKAGKPCGRPVVLEPSIGGGALAAALIRATGGNVYIDGFDIDEPACKAATARMKAAFGKRKAVVEEYEGPPRWNGDGYTVWLGDFLKASPRDMRGFEYIVMNPPFTREAYIKHILHAWKMLDDGGTLAAITWPEWRNKMTKLNVEFRELVETHKVLVEDIPGGTFEHTDMPTVLVVLRKPAPPAEDDEA